MFLESTTMNATAQWFRNGFVVSRIWDRQSGHEHQLLCLGATSGAVDYRGWRLLLAAFKKFVESRDLKEASSLWGLRYNPYSPLCFLGFREWRTLGTAAHSSPKSAGVTRLLSGELPQSPDCTSVLGTLGEL